MDSTARVSATLLCLFLLSLTALGMAQAHPNLPGTWQVREVGVTLVLVFSPDGTGKLDDTRIKYTIKGNTLEIDAGGTVHQYTFVLQGHRSGVGTWCEERAGCSGASSAGSSGGPGEPSDCCRFSRPMARS